MKRFALLFQQVDATTSTNEKVQALQRYFRDEDPSNAVWALYLLLSKTRKRLLTSRVLRAAFLKLSGMPEWLFKDCYAHVGDSAETIALLLRETDLPQPARPLDLPLRVWMEETIPSVKSLETEEALQAAIATWWAGLETFEVFILNKILTGAFRVGVSQKLVVKALAAESGISEAVLTHRLMGDFEPTEDFYHQLLSTEETETAPSQPYPFFLASPLDEARFQAEELDRWQAEWKWDGIRAQVIRRADETFIWSRGEDLVTHQFPEIAESFQHLPDGWVFDGEILCWQDDRPLPFNALQKRLGRKRVSKQLRASHPVRFIAYDLLEREGEDIRAQPLRDRRQFLSDLLQEHPQDCIQLSDCLDFEQFEDLQALRARSRQVGAEGLMLKALDSPYRVGRKRGDWWKYKVDPFSLDAVLIYAQAGSGKRANLFTDYTFALWQEDQLVPFAKAYSGLDNREIEELDRWVRRHTKERFGPVRSVEPSHVFEIGFEGIAESTRHKSGISVRFPRILRWRKDKPTREANTLNDALTLLKTLHQA